MKTGFRNAVGRLVAWLAISALAASGVQAAEGSGTAVIAPSADVIVGSMGTWTITYTSVEAFISGSIEVVIPAGWSPPQIANSGANGFVAVSTAGTLGTPAIAISGMSVIVNIASLAVGQTVDVVYGDTTIAPGGAARAQTYPASNVLFVVRSDPYGPGNRLPIANPPRLNVIPGPVVELVFITPPLAFAAAAWFRLLDGEERAFLAGLLKTGRRAAPSGGPGTGALE